jgi:hypothetical protein
MKHAPIRQGFPSLAEIDLGSVTLHVTTQTFRLERSAEPGVFDTYVTKEIIGATGTNEHEIDLAWDAAEQAFKLADELNRRVKGYADSVELKHATMSLTYEGYARDFDAKVDELLSADPPWRESVDKNGKVRRDQWKKHGVADKCGWDKSTADDRFNHPDFGHLFKPALTKLAGAPKPTAKTSGQGRRTT